MRLSKEQIQYIDSFLSKQGIKYLDIRYELIDHLASDYENSEQKNLDNYLYSKLPFIKDFAKKRKNTIHWAYQNQLWKRIFLFFYKPKYVLTTILILFILYFIVYNLKIKTVIILVFLPIITAQLIGVYFSFKHKTKKLISLEHLFNIMALPSLFLFTFNILKDYFIENKIYLFAFCFLAILFNIAGLIEVLAKRKEVLNKYSFLLDNN